MKLVVIPSYSSSFNLSIITNLRYMMFVKPCLRQADVKGFMWTGLKKHSSCWQTKSPTLLHVNGIFPIPANTSNFHYLLAIVQVNACSKHAKFFNGGVNTKFHYRCLKNTLFMKTPYIYRFNQTTNIILSKHGNCDNSESHE